MTSTAPSTSYEMQLRLAYKARQARFLAAAIGDATAKKISPPVKHVVVSTPPREMQDAHVKDWQCWMKDAGSPCLSHLRRRCADFGITIEALRGPSRKTSLVAIRDLLTFEIRTIVKPGIAWAELGRLMNRDHSAVYYSVMKVMAASGDRESIEVMAKRTARMKRATEASKRRMGK